MELSPPLILSMWTAGIAGGAALIAWWSVVGPGYLWLAGGVVAGLGLLSGLAGGGAAAYGAAALAGFGLIVARHRIATVAVFSLSAVLAGIAASLDSPVVAVLSGSLLLGAITSEMLLGHWFLVDPRLPRRSLLTLDVLAGAGLVLDVAIVAADGSIVLSGNEGVFSLTYLVLAGFTGLLMVGVWFSLREPRYSGVMAATGLSYLAVLTSFGVVTLGRALVTGGVT